MHNFGLENLGWGLDFFFFFGFAVFAFDFKIPPHLRT